MRQYLKNIVILLALIFLLGITDYAHEHFARVQEASFIEKHDEIWPKLSYAIQSPSAVSALSGEERALLHERESNVNLVLYLSLLTKALLIGVFAWLLIVFNRREIL